MDNTRIRKRRYITPSRWDNKGHTERLFNEDSLIDSCIDVHLPSRTVTIDGENISLTHTEFEI